MKNLFAFILTVFLCTTTAQAKELTIAVAGPLSGPSANFGEQIKNGITQAVKDINAAGGVLGMPLKARFYDDACDPKQAVTVANQIAAEQIPLVIGHFCSGSSIPAARVYAEEGILMITPGSTNPQLTEMGYSNVFRMVGRDDQQGATIGKYLLENFAGKKIAIVHDKQTYSKGLATEVKKYLTGTKADIVLEENVNVGERDYTSLVTRLKQNNIDVLVYGGYQNEAGLITRQMREQKLNTVIIGGDGMASNDFWAITGKAGEGALVTFSPDLTGNPENQKLVAGFKKSKISPDGFALYSYAALKLWVDSVNNVGAAVPSKIISHMRLATFDTPLGKVAFDNKGDIKGAAYAVYQFRNGKMVQITK